MGWGGRSIVFQSRMTWLTATVAASGTVDPDRYAGYARHGLREIADRFVNADGSFAWSLDRERVSAGSHHEERHAYGHSFAIYALAAVAKVLDSEGALDLAKGAFVYLEASHHDPIDGGYFEASDSDGRVIRDRGGRDAIGTPYGLKSQNTHLHLLEAFTELYRVWPDMQVRARLEELLELFLGQLYVADGWLHVYVESDWTPVPGAVSHGHDVEAAHLILDAATALGQVDARVINAARGLIDYALRTGWHEAGGFFYSGTPEGKVVDDTKNWWAQAEGLLGLAALFDQTGDPRYAEALAGQWRWIRDHQIDKVHGGWYESVAPNGEVLPSFAKGHAWKAAYHDGRALLFTARLLRQGALSR